MSRLYNPYNLDKEINEGFKKSLEELRKSDKELRQARYKEAIKDQYNIEIYKILDYNNILSITKDENPGYDKLKSIQQDNLFYLTARKVFAYVEYYKVHYHYLGTFNILKYFDWNIIFNSLMLLNKNDITEFLKNGGYGQNLPLNEKYYTPILISNPYDNGFLRFKFLENPTSQSFINVNYIISPLYPSFEYPQENNYLNEYFNYIINLIVEYEKKNLSPTDTGGIFKEQFTEVKKSGDLFELGKKIIQTIGILSFKEWIKKNLGEEVEEGEDIAEQDGGRKYKRKTNKHRNKNRNKHKNKKRKTHKGGFMYEKTKNKYGVAKRYRKTKSKKKTPTRRTTRRTTRNSKTRRSTTRKSTRR